MAAFLHAQRRDMWSKDRKELYDKLCAIVATPPDATSDGGGSVSPCYSVTRCADHEVVLAALTVALSRMTGPDACSDITMLCKDVKTLSWLYALVVLEGWHQTGTRTIKQFGDVTDQFLLIEGSGSRVNITLACIETPLWRNAITPGTKTLIIDTSLSKDEIFARADFQAWAAGAPPTNIVVLTSCEAPVQPTLWERVLLKLF